MQGRGGVVGIHIQQSLGETQSTPWTGNQSITWHCRVKQPYKHTLIPQGNLCHVMPLDWEEAEVPKENPYMHRENTQTSRGNIPV